MMCINQLHRLDKIDINRSQQCLYLFWTLGDVQDLSDSDEDGSVDLMGDEDDMEDMEEEEGMREEDIQFSEDEVM